MLSWQGNHDILRLCAISSGDSGLIRRDVGEAARGQHDLIVVGGGIHGASLAMEAARRGLRPLLLERDDFGGATSWSSMRILHGGLRYLQSLDLRRFRESVSERRWFCRTFPELVEPLACLMPLYGEGLKRPGTFRIALAVNDMLSSGRNEGVPRGLHLPPGRVLDPASTRSLFPSVRGPGLEGGGLWYDALMTSSVRLLMETLRWACRNGATALNYVECVDLRHDRGRVTGVEGLDRLDGETVAFGAPVVVNCAGPWSRPLAGRLDREHPELFRPSLAFNVLLGREPLSEAALAVTPPRPGAPTYFLTPRKGRILAGTFHAACNGYPTSSAPSDGQIDCFLADLNVAVPGLELTRDDVVRVDAGLLPAKARGTEEPAVRDVILDHAATGGPSGLWSVSGVKYTTARRVAERTLRRVFGGDARDLSVRPGCERPAPAPGLFASDASALGGADAGETGRLLGRLVETEAVMCVDDLLLRRTEWGGDPELIDAVAASVTRLLGRDLPSRAELGLHDAPLA
jgi:glycerol-3-phosphate dehydrogenase